MKVSSEMKRKQRIAFQVFETYAKTLTGINITNLNENIGSLEKIDCSGKNLENIGKSLYLNFDQSVDVVKYLVDISHRSGSADMVILWQMSYDLLKCSDQCENTIYSALENIFGYEVVPRNLLDGPPAQTDDEDEDESEDIDTPTQASEPGTTTSGEKESTLIYSLPVSNIDISNFGSVLSRTNLCKSFYDVARDGKVAMIVGRRGSGKESMVKRIVLNDINERHIYSRVFYFTERCFDYGNMLSQILYTIKKQNTSSLSLEEMAVQAAGCLVGGMNLFIFEEVNQLSENSINQIANFCLRIAGNTNFILLSETKDMNIIGCFKKKRLIVEELRMPPNLDLDEWHELAQYLRTRRPDVNSALENYPSIVDWLYGMGSTELDYLKEALYYVAERIGNCVPVEVVKAEFEKDRASKVLNPERISYVLGNLTDEERRLAATISLFDQPASYVEISKVSGMTTLLEKAIQGCRDKDIIDNCWIGDDKVGKLHIPHDYKNYIREKILNDPEKYRDIIDGWINLYKDFTKEIGMCFDKQSLLTKYDDKSSNMSISGIESVLYYCDQNCRWSDYYDISFNARYYFFVRGLSGTDENNVHEKRAKAAMMMRDPNLEFEARLYYCNVCSKRKFTDSVDFNFMRMEELERKYHIDPVMRAKFRYVKGLYCLSLGICKDAYDWFDRYFDVLSENNIVISDKLDKELRYDIAAAKRWKCDCLCHIAENDPQNAEEYLSTIESIADEVEKETLSLNFTRGYVHSIINRVRILRLIDERRSEARSTLRELDKYKDIIEADSYYSKYYYDLNGKLEL